MTLSHISRSTKDKWQKMTKTCSPSQTDVIFVVMDALVHVLESEVLLLLTAFLKMTARNHAHALDLGCSDRLVFANQNARAIASSCSCQRVTANQNAHTFDVSYSNQPSVADQDIHTFDLFCSQDEVEDEAHVVDCCHDFR